jgi:3-hydroxybutyryl-CoA dehydrogenase
VTPHQGLQVMKVAKVGMVGCGLMCAGIARVCATAGHRTIVREIAEGLLQQGLATIDKSLGRSVEKGKVTEKEKREIQGRLEGVVSFEEMTDCDLVVASGRLGKKSGRGFYEYSNA